MCIRDRRRRLRKVAYHEFEGVADDFDEQKRISAHLSSSAHTLIMRNHGSVTIGSSIGQAFVRTFYLDRVCTAQMHQMQCGTESTPLSDQVLSKMAEQYESPDFAPGVEWGGLMELAELKLGCDW
eukprot:TRINITY_DN20394_c0_g1_i1.p1 TRINITY_DN20394_c0_g1~~TRINITY_DN20394_c0_g1_i1.p1  ORF type:complete len:134 (+),score=38.78 TRINITY_DN20394_c0_g1_i1:30-404(+)